MINWHNPLVNIGKPSPPRSDQMGNRGCRGPAMPIGPPASNLAPGTVTLWWHGHKCPYHKDYTVPAEPLPGICLCLHAPSQKKRPRCGILCRQSPAPPQAQSRPGLRQNSPRTPKWIPRPEALGKPQARRPKPTSAGPCPVPDNPSSPKGHPIILPCAIHGHGKDD